MALPCLPPLCFCSAALCRRALLLAICLCFASLPPALAANDDDILLFIPVILATPSGNAAIGAAGGTVRAGTASVAIAPNTLAQSVTVTLTSGRRRPDFLGQPASLVYSLNIASGDLTKDLAVTLAGFGGPDRDVVVALADRADYDTSQMATRPALVTGRVRSGVLTFAIPATEVQTASGGLDQTSGTPAPVTPTRTGYTFWAMAGFNTMESAHFRLYFPASIQAGKVDMAQLILNDAEDAYTRLQGLGFVMTGLSIPTSITVESGLGSRDGEAGLPLSGKAGQFLNLNVNLCTPATADKLRATIGHEYFHIVQNLYDPRSALRIRHPSFRPYFLWLSEASSVWFESVVLESSSYVSDIFVSNIDSCRQGLETFADHTEAQSIGYAASGFLRYLTDARGSNTIINTIWNEVRDEGKGTSAYSDLTAVIRGVGSGADTAIKWTDYMQRLLTNNSGHTGWPEPSATATYYSHTVQGYVTAFDFLADVAPFSARKWKVLFNKLRAGETDYFARLDSNDDVEYALYKSAGPSQYARLGVIAANAPLNFTVAEGNSIVVTASNSDTASPYQTGRSAAVHIGLKGTCQYCPGIPSTATLAQAGDTFRLWEHETKRFTVAKEAYWDDTRTKIAVTECHEYDTGCLTSYSERYENGHKKEEFVYACDGGGGMNGPAKYYYDTGILRELTTYDHGRVTGPYASYYPNGNYQVTGYKDNGTPIGLWTYYYSDDGKPSQICTYVGLNLICHDPD